MKLLASIQIQLSADDLDQLRDPTEPGLRVDLPVFESGRIHEYSVHLDGPAPEDDG